MAKDKQKLVDKASSDRGEAIKEDHPMMKGLKAICTVADEN